MDTKTGELHFVVGDDEDLDSMSQENKDNFEKILEAFKKSIEDEGGKSKELEGQISVMKESLAKKKGLMPLTEKEFKKLAPMSKSKRIDYAKRKKKNKQAKLSRKKNRGKSKG